METDNPSQTSPTLIGRVGQNPRDQAAWDQFVGRYGPKIQGWCRQWGLQPSDADDVTQDVLLRLAGKLWTFRYDPARSFRGWLRTMTRHALSDFLADRSHRCVGSGDDRVLEALRSVRARDDLLARLEAEFDREVVEKASARVRARVEPQTWEAFLLTAYEGLAGDAVAARLGMKVTAVFKAKSRVLALIRGEMSTLDDGA